MSFYYPSGPEAEKAYADYARKNEESRKRRAKQVAELEPQLAAAKKQFDREMGRYSSMSEGSRSIEIPAARARYAKAIEAITGVAKEREQFERDYVRRNNGRAFNPDNTYAPEPVAPGGLGSGLAAVREALRGFAGEAAKAVAGAGDDEQQMRAFEHGLRQVITKAFAELREIKSFRGHLIQTKSASQAGVVEAIVSVSGNEDFGGDIVVPGAFRRFIGDVKSGKARMPALVWSHQIEAGQVTGKVLDLVELEPGSPLLPSDLHAEGLGALKVTAKYNLNTTRGKDAYQHVIDGEISDWSFQYQAPLTSIDSKGRRLLKEIFPVYEVSNVLIGMNSRTRNLSWS